MFENDEKPLPKRERTRAAIRAVAIRSLREQGYDATTMRGIAEQAGLSVGNAYYHFPTKDHLVQELYVDVQHEHRAAALPLLDTTDDLTARIGVVVRTGLANLQEYHAIAPQFLTAAMAPGSPVNPLSTESSEARDLVLDLFRRAVAGSRQKLPADLAEDLPMALWMGYLLFALFWTYDTSPDQRRTERLVDSMLRVLRFALPMLRVRPFRSAVSEIVGIVAGRAA
ncbi:TetR family transcriptional regulator [Curtobacterium sp. MCLR17_007]|uniref:TetR/AcrR family transcriptional regulator n=1 Tax=Curtobacterium sp. MCLR17_007 TaxID=2175648 RepID=UPI000DA979A4|nr:TetR/AcrR family transcriptional regulator [Curtobacterium sp. MCLR17_007]WIB60919.1 TetR family transcriptional regulator [Curtobacterium sp. MCLR17_007]